MTNSKMRRWLRALKADRASSRFACTAGLEEASCVIDRYNNDEMYYRKSSNPVNFLWGVAYRQPELALECISKIAVDKVRLIGVTDSVRAAFAVSIDGDRELEMLDAFRKVSSMKHGTSNNGVDQIAYRLLRWRLGAMRSFAAAEGIRLCLARHAKLMSSRFDFLPEFKNRVPFELWESGFGDCE